MKLHYKKEVAEEIRKELLEEASEDSEEDADRSMDYKYLKAENKMYRKLVNELEEKNNLLKEKIERIEVNSQPKKLYSETLIKEYPKNKKKFPV